MTTWKGMTMAATYIMNRNVDHLVLLRTSTHAVMAEHTEMIASDSTVMMTESFRAFRKLKVGLFHTAVMFSNSTFGFSGMPTAELMISALVRMEFISTMKKGSMNSMNSSMQPISASTRRRFCRALFWPTTSSSL